MTSTSLCLKLKLLIICVRYVKKCGRCNKCVNSKINKPVAEMLSKSDFMKLSSQNFIENERLGEVYTHDTKEFEDVTERHKYTHATRSHGDLTKEKEKSDLTTQRRLLHNTKAIQENCNEKDSSTHSSFKRYVTRCYIKPVHVPYWYSETVQLKIGSNIKNYDEKVHFKSTYMPYHWKESMTTFTPQTGEPLIYKSYLEIPIKSDFHYMSLEPQQIQTDTKNLVETFL